MGIAILVQTCCSGVEIIDSIKFRKMSNDGIDCSSLHALHMSENEIERNVLFVSSSDVDTITRPFSGSRILHERKNDEYTRRKQNLIQLLTDYFQNPYEIYIGKTPIAVL